MPQLLKLRFVSLGHPQARMEDLVIPFHGPDGRAVDSTLWLRNGGGKSSILNLFFAIIRPHRAEFLGGKAEAKQRSLNDYILSSDRAVAAAEWQLDPAADSLGLEQERFVTGVFYERREGSGELRRLFFACRVQNDVPESTIEGLPLYATSSASRSRRTLGAFREAWRSLRDRAPHLNVADTENQREWQEVLEAARIDPELFSYQVTMNQREGGADELFRFDEAEEFIDFLLAIALDPALGDRVGNSIGAFRRELLLRKEQLVPERDLVVGLNARMNALRDLRARRARVRVRLGEAHTDLENLGALATTRQHELVAQAAAFDVAHASHEAAADAEARQALAKRGRAAQLMSHAAALRCARLQEEHDQVQDEWRKTQRLARIWSAAVPLRRALQFEGKAHDQRKLLAERESEHAPLRDELETAANKLASALDWRAEAHRKKRDDDLTAEKTARNEARGYRQQAVESGRLQSQAETQARGFEERIASVEARRLQLVREGLLRPDEVPEAGATWWTTQVADDKAVVERHETEIGRLGEAIDALDIACSTATDVVSVQHAQRRTLEERLELATGARAALERDPVIARTLELETVDADRLGKDALATLEHAERNAQRRVVETRLAVADDERAVVHLEGHGLLPPSPDAQRVIDFLHQRLGGQAWSGWSWIEANVPASDALKAVRKASALAQGVIVRPSDLERAVELLRDAGLEPDGPVLLGDTNALARHQDPPGTVLGPREAAWFDRNAATKRLATLRARLDEAQLRIQAAETQHRDVTRAMGSLRAFRERYEVGWFEATSRELEGAQQREADARSELLALQTERALRTSARKKVEEDLREHRRRLDASVNARRRVSEFVDDFVQPAVTWRKEVETAALRAKKARDEVKQWEDLAEVADARAAAASQASRTEGEEARVLEVERAALEYIGGSPVAEAGPLDLLRDRYELLRSQYEEKVGADALAALAKQNEENAREERTRLAKLLSAEVTEEVVRDHLTNLAEPDTVDRLRQEAETKASSLQGRMGNLKGRIDPAEQALKKARDACTAFVLLPPLQHVPSTAELAEAEAAALEEEATLHNHDADAERLRASDAEQQAKDARHRVSELAGHSERLVQLRDHYADLLAESTPPTSGSAPPTFGDAAFPAVLKKLGDVLRGARADWKGLDAERGSTVGLLRALAAEPQFDGLDAPWVRRLQEHDEPALEASSEQLAEQLELRRAVLEDQIAGVDRHRNVLVDELHAAADEGLKLLRQASNLSKLPEHLPGIGGAHFLRIQTQEPNDPSEKRARLAELVDELVGGKHDLGGVSLVQAAVRKLARPVQVRVLHPDPALERRAVTIPEMARSSGGEQLTAAILLYCTLARVRGRSRALSRRASGVLILDNPIGRASRVRFLDIQRDVARAMGIQLIYATGVNDHEALHALPNVIRLRNERVDRNTGRRLVEHAAGETRVIQVARVGRRETASPARTDDEES